MTTEAATTATEAAATTETATTTATEATTTATETLAGKTEAAATTATTEQVSDWRKQIAAARANGDADVEAKIMKRLERFTDQGKYDEAFEQTQAALRDSGRIKLPGKDATEDEIKAFNKSLGVPDKADAYKLTLPTDVELDDGDKAQLKAITEYLHKRGGMAGAPETVQAAADLFMELREQSQAQAVAQAAQFAQDSEKALKQQWGPDYAKNIAYTGPGLVALLGKEGDDLRTLQLANGARLGDHPLFVKALAQAGRAMGDDPVFWQATQMQGDGKSLEARKSEIMRLRTSSASGDREKYAELSKPGGELAIINARLEAIRKPGAAA